MKTLFTLILCAVCALSASAAEIIRGTTLTDGQQLYASDLHGLIDNSTIGVQFFNDAQTTPTLSSGYYFLALDPANQVYRRINAQAMLYSNTNFWLYQSQSSTVQSNATFLFYDPTNNYIRSVTYSNLMSGAASYITVSKLSYGGTNGPALTFWSGPFSGLQTNNQPSTLFWGSNGIPYALAYSNLEASEAADLGTNFSLPFTFNQVFQPWLVYGTNINFTNAWGYQTNFPIVGLTLTNAFNPTNPAPTISGGDTIPINSVEQFTNTTVTLATLYAWFTNQNATLTPAKISFNGKPQYWSLFPQATNANFVYVTNTAPFALGSVYGIAFVTNTTALPFSGMKQNQIYYINVEGTNTTQKQLSVFATYSNAVADLTPIAINSGITTNCMVAYLQPYSQFNCDAIPVETTPFTNPNTARTGVYDIYFRYPFASGNYYVNGTVLESSDNNGAFMVLNIDNQHTVNFVRIGTYSYYSVPLNTVRVDVVITPP